jgi:hypothetical protein
MAAGCPSCGAPRAAGPNCPACGNPYTETYVGIAETIPQIPSGQPAAAPRPAAPDNVPCPMCSEPIARGAARCKWCGENIGAKPTGIGAPSYQPPRPQYSAPAANVQRPDGTAALVLGINGLAGGFFSCGTLWFLGIIAWVLGNGYVKKCREAGLEPEGAGSTGRVLGIIGTIFFILAVLGWIAYIGLIAVAVGSQGMR